jgi:hypothetical protein
VNKHEDIFQLENLEDLPQDIKKIVINGKRGLQAETQNILALFDIKPILNVNEIIVGYYRKYKVERAREWFSSTAYNLCSKGLLKKIAPATFEKVNKND